MKNSANTESVPSPFASRKPLRKKKLFIVCMVLLLLVLLPAGQVLILRFCDPPLTMTIFYSIVRNRLQNKPVRWWYEPVGSSQLNDHIRRAVVSAEDQRFFRHNGFDFIEIEQALDKHRRRPESRLRGASTISQQVAKNLFLPPWRSYLRKGLEAYYTLWLELLWPKERILEMYLNIAQMGPDVYGVQAAAQYHFGKDPAHLTPGEAALLAATLPNPVRWSASRPTQYIKDRAQWIEEQMPAYPF
jgi:monofunctional biosynthetic peptidoglycan transglycosylase